MSSSARPQNRTSRASRAQSRGDDARHLIASSVVWEGAVGWSTECAPYTDGVLHRYRQAGFDHLSLTVAAEWNALEPTLRYLAAVRRFFLDHPNDFTIVARAEDVPAAKAEGKLAVSFHFQGAGPFADDSALVEPFAALGVKLAILAYNRTNALGSGCQEPDDAGLTPLGRRFVGEMNRVGMMIDLSHVGERTALEAIDASSVPVVISHSNPRAVHFHVRNVGDDVIRGCAARGGVVGINSLAFMLSADAKASVETYVRHLLHVADLVGPEHVALGMDWNFYDPFMQRMYAGNPGLAEQGYPPPPWDSLAPETLPQIVSRLLGAGWGDEAIRGLLGHNMMRVAEAVWR